MHWSDFDAQAVVNVLDRVHRVLAVQGCKQDARRVLNIHELIHDRILLVKLVLLLDRLDNRVLGNLLWNKLIVLARKVA